MMVETVIQRSEANDGRNVLCELADCASHSQLFRSGIGVHALKPKDSSMLDVCRICFHSAWISHEQIDNLFYRADFMTSHYLYFLV